MEILDRRLLSLVSGADGGPAPTPPNSVTTQGNSTIMSWTMPNGNLVIMNCSNFTFGVSFGLNTQGKIVTVTGNAHGSMDHCVITTVDGTSHVNISQTEPDPSTLDAVGADVAMADPGHFDQNGDGNPTNDDAGYGDGTSDGSYAGPGAVASPPADGGPGDGGGGGGGGDGGGGDGGGGGGGTPDYPIEEEGIPHHATT